VDVIEVDALDPEPLQRPFERLAHVGGAVVMLALSLRRPANGELCREHDLRPAASNLGEELADHRLAYAVAIDVRRVPEVDPDLQRVRQRPQTVALAGRPIEAAEAHAAQADGRYCCISKRPALHPLPSQESGMPIL